MDWMVTERAEDLKTLMHDNATFIQFPPIGSSTSLITVFGEHRVNVQRTIRSIMQLVCLTWYCQPRSSDAYIQLGVSLLCGLPLATSGAVQCSHAFEHIEPDSGFRDPQAGFLRHWRRGRIQGNVLRNART